MKIKTPSRRISAVYSYLLMSLALSIAFIANPVCAEEDATAPVDVVIDIPADAATATGATAGEEAIVPADVPVSKQDLMTQAADGEVAQPRIRKFMKPNRSQLHASVNNQKSGYSFLDENQRKPGVVKLKSGLQYKVLRAGSGAKPTENDIVKCQFRGALIDGTVFDQSAAGMPANIKVASQVPGLIEAVKLMSVGSKWQVYLPPGLGFGSTGLPPKVGPDAVLIYDIDLLGINSAASDKH